jgi:hypothetical protein
MEESGHPTPPMSSRLVLRFWLPALPFLALQIQEQP